MSIRTDNPGYTHKGPGRLYSHGLPSPYPLSATWWIYVEDRQAAGYFTAFAYGPSVFGGVDYYTAAGVFGEWSCGAASTDSTTGVQIAENRWWRQGFRCRRLADNSVQHEFFYDLPNTASRQNNVDGAFNYFQTVSSSHFLRWADVEWSPNETLIGRIGGIKIWNAYLPQQVLAAEAMSNQIISEEYKQYLWAHIPLRHLQDRFDISGKGRHFYYSGSLPLGTSADPPLISTRKYTLYAPDSGSGFIINLGQVTETDTVQTISKIKTKAIGQLSETNTIQTITRVKSRSLSQISETALAQAFSKFKVKVVNQVTETDLSQSIIRAGSAIPVAQVTEVDISQTISKSKTAILNQISEINFAQSVSRLKTKNIAQLSETNTAQNVTWAPKNRLLTTAFEIDVAQLISVSGIFSAKSGLSKLLKLGVSSSGVTVEDRLSEDN